MFIPHFAFSINANRNCFQTSLLILIALPIKKIYQDEEGSSVDQVCRAFILNNWMLRSLNCSCALDAQKLIDWNTLWHVTLGLSVDKSPNTSAKFAAEGSSISTTWVCTRKPNIGWISWIIMFRRNPKAA